MAATTIRTVFIYPPSKTFADDPEGWWSWPGTDFDAEGRQKKFMEAMRGMEQRLGLRIRVDDASIWTAEHIHAAAKELETDKPDGLVVVVFYNGSRAVADNLIQAAEKMGIPVVLYIGLGVCHGWGRTFLPYRRKGLRFIMSLDNFDAIEESLRMIQEGRTLGLGPWPGEA